MNKWSALLVIRDKSVGEMNPEQLWETTMNPETRRLIRVTLNNIEEADRDLMLCMGKDVSARREFILGETD